MKNPIRILLLLFPMILLCSCATVVVPPNFGEYQKDATRLHLKTDPQMHLYQGIPHTLVFCVYQLIDPNDFNQLLDEERGLEKLCECTKFSPSVTNAKRFIIEPNREYTESLDRPANAKYVGVVAGYYHLQKENVVRLLLYPVVEEKKGNTIYQKPGILNIDLYLSPQQIQDARGK